MTKEITTYYIPVNPNIAKGPIYTLYLNKNTNLNLNSIINHKEITPNQIIITGDEFNKLIELNNREATTTAKRSAYIEAFIESETKTKVELAKINTERQELIKKLTKKGIPQ